MHCGNIAWRWRRRDGRIAQHGMASLQPCRDPASRVRRAESGRMVPVPDPRTVDAGTYRLYLRPLVEGRLIGGVSGQWMDDQDLLADHGPGPIGPQRTRSSSAHTRTCTRGDGPRFETRGAMMSCW